MGLKTTEAANWEGAPGTEDWHRSTGKRAWSMPEKVGQAGTSEWCSENDWCEGCRYVAGQMPVWLPEKGSKEWRALTVTLGQETLIASHEVERVLDALWKMRR